MLLCCSLTFRAWPCQLALLFAACCGQISWQLIRPIQLPVVFVTNHLSRDSSCYQRLRHCWFQAYCVDTLTMERLLLCTCSNKCLHGVNGVKSAAGVNSSIAPLHPRVAYLDTHAPPDPYSIATHSLTLLRLLCCCLHPRMAKYMVAGEFEHYHGEAINPKHLSTWER